MPTSVSPLLRISSELDIIGDVTASVATPSDLLAWTHALPEPAICAWRAELSGNRYVQVSPSATATLYRAKTRHQCGDLVFRCIPAIMT